MQWLNLLSAQRENAKESQIDPSRSPFDQDFDRIIFSHPFRRLQDKTQVFPMPEHDFVHTRLTHSLEVSVVGRSLGKSVGAEIIQRHPDLAHNQHNLHDIGAIVAAAALTHDIGNPPFGHAGEDALSDFFIHHAIGQQFKNILTEKEWQDIISFEGNAQGFRLMNKNSYEGLRLTYATLAAFTKYPRESKIEKKDGTRRSQKKYGFFQSEKTVYQNIAQQIGLLGLSENTDLAWARHPLAFLVEAADDICYNLIDLEDGCRLGLVSFEEVKDLMADILGERFQPSKLEKLSSLNEKLGMLRALAIGELVNQSKTVFLDHEADMLSGRFDQSLTDILPSKEVLKHISKISVDKIYRSRQVLEKEAAGYEVLGGLLEAFCEAIWYKSQKIKGYPKRVESIYRLMPDELKDAIQSETVPTYELLRLCLDHISSMTDTYAIGFYRKIKGMTMVGR